MRKNNHYIPITNDCFDIAARLKSIDESYFVLYNATKTRFEVHSGANAGKHTLCAVVPHPCLDARTVEHIRATRVERINN